MDVDKPATPKIHERPAFAARYDRQTRVPQVQKAGQQKLRDARVLLIGCGALGSTVAEQLVRAGVGRIDVCDRDVVEFSNLQRQSLFDESDATRGVPKAQAAARRLREINSEVHIEPIALDVDATNILSLCASATIILDGSDNAQTRYLINDVSVKNKVAWVMGGVIATEGRACAFVPDRANQSTWTIAPPCLRCLFQTPPAPGELPTCDVAGVLGPAVGVAASLQVALAMKVIVNDPSAADLLFAFDVWSGTFRTINVADARVADCVCCGLSKFEFLDQMAPPTSKLCGRNAIQVRGPTGRRIDLINLADRLMSIAAVERSDLMIKFVLHERPDLAISVFCDGRMLMFGTEDQTLARGVYAKIIGT